MPLQKINGQNCTENSYLCCYGCDGSGPDGEMPVDCPKIMCKQLGVCFKRNRANFSVLLKSLFYSILCCLVLVLNLLFLMFLRF